MFSRKYLLPGILAGLLWISGAPAAELPPGFSETEIAIGLNPTTMTFAPDGRLFLCEKQGLVRVIDGDKLLDLPFLDISGKVDAWNERGLLSICFDPKFLSNGWIYVYYTHNRDPRDSSHRSSNNRVSRFTAQGNVALPNSEKVLLEIDDLSKTGWHNGGGLAFGEDGKLYISTGENADAPNAQNDSNLLGKLLRINKDGSIPTDNPHYRKLKGKNRTIIALGLRNPYSIAAQPGSGLLYLSEVGANYEQIEHYDSNGKPEAVNFGWPDVDGPPRDQKLPSGYQPPAHPYDHGKGRGTALCGGDFYQPSERDAGTFPASYIGKFFFSDYGGWIRYIDPAKPEIAHDFATGINRPIDIATAPDGALWYIERAGIPGGSDDANSASDDGSLWRVQWDGGGQAAKLAMEFPPQHSYPGTPLGEVRIILQSADGKTVATATDRITLALGQNPSGAKLTGNTTVTAINGIATFTALAIDKPGRGYTLRARSGKMDTVSSRAFDIEPGVAPAVITPSGGNFTGPVSVRITSITPAAEIHYTLDGSTPSKASPRYEAPFKITESCTIQAISSADGPATKVEFQISGSTPYGIDTRPPVTGLKLPATVDEDLPATLSATGIFTDRQLTPKPGIIPYDLNSTIWADGAKVRRWVALPPSEKVGFSPSGEFSWPGGTVFIQHFEIVTDAPSRATRRLETRLLVLDATGNFGYGVTYRWRPDQSDADLVNAAGRDEILTVTDSSGSQRDQIWTYPARGLCHLCHTPNAGFVLGPKSHQLNGDFTYPGGHSDNQLRTWNYLQMFAPGIDESSIKDFPKTCRIDDPTASVDHRFRSYLDGNCANCHRPGGTGAQWDARFETPFADQGILNGDVRNTFGIDGAKLLVPGDISKSMLHFRMSSTQLAEQMPPLTRNHPDAAALKLLKQWIEENSNNR